MWGYAIEDLLTNGKYGGLDIHKGADWIRADILHDLMKEGIVSPNDVFDCLTPLVTTQNKLKEHCKKNHLQITILLKHDLVF